MKKVSLVFATLILGLFIPQRTYSEETRLVTVYADSSIRHFVLWKIRTKSIDSSENWVYRNGIYVTIDSVLKGEDFHDNKKWYIPKLSRVFNEVSLNSYYLVLADAWCPASTKGRCLFSFRDTDYILPDTPENREFLIKKWSETKVIYKPSIKYPNVGDIDM